MFIFDFYLIIIPKNKSFEKGKCEWNDDNKKIPKLFMVIGILVSVLFSMS
jgi:hypothetical protein